MSFIQIKLGINFLNFVVVQPDIQGLEMKSWCRCLHRGYDFLAYIPLCFDFECINGRHTITCLTSTGCGSKSVSKGNRKMYNKASFCSALHNGKCLSPLLHQLAFRNESCTYKNLAIWHNFANQVPISN